MRSPPITSGYSRPSSDLTFSIAPRIAWAFSSLVKSVKGSLRNSAGIISSKLFLFFRDSSVAATKGQIWLARVDVGGEGVRGKPLVIFHLSFLIFHLADPKA